MANQVLLITSAAEPPLRFRHIDELALHICALRRGGQLQLTPAAIALARIGQADRTTQGVSVRRIEDQDEALIGYVVLGDSRPWGVEHQRHLLQAAIARAEPEALAA